VTNLLLKSKQSSEADAVLAYPGPAVAARIEGGGKGGTEGRNMTGDVALANNAAARDKRDHFRSAPTFSKAGKTANELRLIFRDGWGVLDDDQHGRGLFAILLHTIAHTGGDVAAKMRSAWREFAPWLSEADFERLADEAIKVRRRWKADKLAQRIGLTYADRQRLGITMIGAVDVPKAERDRRREARKVEARRAKRRAAGVIPRDQYEANARALRAEAAALGITPDALRKRRQRAAQRALSQVRRQHKDVSLSARFTLGTPRPDCTAATLARKLTRRAKGRLEPKASRDTIWPGGPSKGRAPCKQLRSFQRIAKKDAA
jgi:hypothetical protein